MNKLCVLIAMFLIGCGESIDSRVVRLERDVISTESAIAGIERDLYEVKGDVAELKESISLVGVKIDVLSRLISESPVSESKEPRDPSWDDCGDGVLPEQTEVPAPYPMPDKPADDAPADLQRRVSELEQAKGIFGNVVLMANDAKIAADEEHKDIRKEIKELEIKLNKREHDWLQLSLLREDLEALPTKNDGENSIDRGSAVHKDPSIEFRPYKWKFDGTDGMIITFSLNSWGEKFFRIMVSEEWDVIRADGFLIDGGKRIASEDIPDEDNGHWVSMSLDENVLSSRHLRTRNFKSGHRYEIDVYLHAKQDREYYDKALRQ